MKTAFLFSGQGSQYVGMMKDFYNSSSAAKNIIDNADKILGRSISNVCMEGPLEELKLTKNTQPAIFLHSAVLTLLLKDRIQFNGTAGHSVGEYSALFASGVLDFESALRLVALRGELMYAAGFELPGTMFAVISNLPDENVKEVCDNLTANASGNVVVAANYNSPGQIVVSGSADYLRSNVQAFKDAGAKIVKELFVSGAFHSPLMLPAKEKLASAINNTYFADAKVPVYTNISGNPITRAQDIKHALIEQLTSPVLWTQSMQNMKQDGFSKFIEIGPGKVLQGLLKRTIDNAEISGFDTAEELNQFNIV